ncbi:hypothetical protein FRB91_009298 [Serendipita sp. 411]|nr:hypothetical protein FRB91_009298 [Serendipita sp. 411]
MPTSVPVSLPASASVSVSPSTSATIPVPVSIPVPAKPKQSGDSDVMMEEGEVAVTPRGWTRSSLPSSSSSTARKIANTNKNSSVSATASASATATRTKSTTTPRTTTTTIATLPSSSSGATAIPVSTGSVPPLPPLAEVVKQQQEQKQEQQQQLTSTSISVDTDEEMEVAQNLYDNDNDSDRNSNPQVLPLAPISRTGEDKNLVLQRIRAGGDDAGAVVDARLRFQTGGTTTQELSDVEKRFIHAVWDRRVRALMEIGQLNAKKEEVTSLLETMARARSAPNSSGGLDQRENKLIEVKRDIERMLKEVMDRLRREERGLEEEALRLYVGDGASAPGGNKGGEVVARLENARVRLDELTRRVWPDRQRQLQLQQNQRRQLTADVGLTNVTTAAVTKSTTTSGTVTPKVEGEEGEEMEVEEEEEEEEEEAEITEAELEVLEEKMMDLGLDFDDIEYGVEGNVMVQSLVEKEVARLARLNKLKPGDVSAQGNTARGATKEEMEEIVGLELEVKVDEEWDKEAQVQLEEVRKYMRRLEERTERARRELDQEKESLRVMKEKVEAAEKRLEALERQQGEQHRPMTESELHVQATQLMVSAATLIEREWKQKLEGVREDIHVSASEAMEEAKRIMERVRKEEMERWEGKEGREGERGDEVRILEKVAGSLQGTLVWQNAVAEYLNGLAIASAGVGSGPGPGPGASVGANETEGAHSLGQPRARV